MTKNLINSMKNRVRKIRRNSTTGKKAGVLTGFAALAVSVMCAGYACTAQASDVLSFFQNIAAESGEEAAASTEQDAQTVQMITTQWYMGGQKMPDFRETFWDEEGALLATKARSVNDDYSNSIQHYLDHAEETGMIIDGTDDVPETTELITGEDTVSVSWNTIRTWRRPDPYQPAYFLPALIEQESVYKSMAACREAVYDSSENPLLVFSYDDWGGLTEIRWGEELAKSAAAEVSETTDQDGNRTETSVLPLQYRTGTDGDFLDLTSRCTKVYDPDGKLLRYEYEGPSSYLYDEDLVSIICTYEYDENGMLQHEHRETESAISPVDRDVYYTPDGKVAMSVQSDTCFTIFQYDESGTIQDIYKDVAGSWDKYEAFRFAGTVPDEAEAPDTVWMYHFEPDGQTVHAVNEGSGTDIEAVTASSALYDTKTKTVKGETDDGSGETQTIVTMNFDEFAVAVSRRVVNAQPAPDGTMETEDNGEVPIYESTRDTINGERYYYRQEELALTAVRGNAPESEAYFNPAGEFPTLSAVGE